MKKFYLLLVFVLSNIYFLKAQPSIQWQKSFGGEEHDVARCIRQTSDGGYVVAGYTYSTGGDVTLNHGGQDYWIVKINSTGGMEWQKTYGGISGDEGEFIQETKDGGYIIAGSTYSNDGDVTGNHGAKDCWIVKLDNLGTLQWQKCYGGSLVDEANCIIEIDDGYMIAGTSFSLDSDVTVNRGYNDCWLIKIDNAGSIIWQKTYGGEQPDAAKSVWQTHDGGFIMGGYSLSTGGQVSNHHGVSDFWIVRLDSDGNIIWESCFGGYGLEEVNSIRETADNGFIATGQTGTPGPDGDVVSLNHGNSDFWVVKLNSTGSLIWEKCFGGSKADYPQCLDLTTDGGYVISGYSRSNDFDVTGHHGLESYTDAWVIKIDASANLQWQRSLGGSQPENAYSVMQAVDDGYVFCSSSSSSDGDCTENHGVMDFWVVKLGTDVSVNELQNSISDMNVMPNPMSGFAKISFQNSIGEKIRINISDLQGRIIKNFSLSQSNVGRNEFVWDATNEAGSKVAAGFYLINLFSENSIQTRKIEVLGSE